MPGLYPENPVQCDDCASHFALSPSMATDGLACPECGGKRLFRTQPSPTQSDGTLRDMVDSDTQQDQGGNPLGEGTIVGRDGEQPAFKRDNFSPSMASTRLAWWPEDERIEDEDPYAIHGADPEAICPECGSPATHMTMGTHVCPAGHEWVHPPEQERLGAAKSPTNVTQKVEMRTLNTEPYMPWTHEASIRTAGPAIPLLAEGEVAALPAEVGAAGAAAGALGDAAGAAADAGGGLLSDLGSGVSDLVGGGRGVAKKLVGPLMKGVLHAGESALGIGGGGQQSGGMAPQPVTQAPNMLSLGSADIPMVLLADLETPNSVNSVDEQEDDPHQQDQKEFSDGDDSPSNHKNPNNEDSGTDGEDGVRDATDGYGFGDNSPGLERMMMVLPLLLHYFQSNESGEQDPIIRALHETLEGESPGYLKQEDPDGHSLVQMVIQQHKQPHGVHAGVGFPSGLPAVPGGAPAAPAAPAPGGGTCPRCGSPMVNNICPTCSSAGAGAPSLPPTMAAEKEADFRLLQQIADLRRNLPQEIQHQVDDMMVHQGPNAVMSFLKGMAPTGDGLPGAEPQKPGFFQRLFANHVGPVTPEQIAAVAQILIDQGRSGEIETMKRAPQLYQEELQQVQSNPNPAPPLVDPAQSQPPAPMDQAPGAMPMPDMGGGAGGQPMQPMSGFMAHLHEAGYKQADANNRVPRCPKCGTATTSLVSGGGDIDPAKALGKCHNPGCDHVWKLAEPKEAKQVWADVPNPVTLPAAEQNAPVDREHTHDPTMQWVDNEGNELQANQVYELHSPAYPVPDEIRILDVKPDAVSVQLVGMISNQHNTEPDFEITRQEAQLEHYTFVPSQTADPNADDRNTEPPTGTPGLEQVPPSGPTTDQVADSYPNTALSHVTEPDEDPPCLKCGSTTVDHNMVSATRVSHACVRCAHYWETEDDFQGREARVDLEWLRGSNMPEDDFDFERRAAMAAAGTGQSRNIADVAAKDNRLQAIKAVLDANDQARTAGRNFTPSEKRALIDENGRARNLGDLDLSNTHYDTQIDYTGKANAENVDDAHFALGL